LARLTTATERSTHPWELPSDTKTVWAGLANTLAWWSPNRVKGVRRALVQRRADLRDNEVFSQSILDLVQAEIALLDREGVIVEVTAPWQTFAQDNAATIAPGQMPYSYIGVNHLAIDALRTIARLPGASEP